MVMFFGLCNSPATFQQMMDKIFRDEIHEAWIIIYMDDMFIFTKELIDNIRHTRRILQKLRDNDLYIKPEKCVFWQPKVEYLGMIIEENRIGMDPVKLRGIAEWPTPKTVKEVRSFLGFGNYYRKFIDGYGDLTTPLNELLRKEEKFEWTPTETIGIRHPQGQISGGPGPPDARPSQAFCGRVRCLQIRIRSSKTPTAIGTRAATYHSLSTLRNGITKSTTGNCWPSFGL